MAAQIPNTKMYSSLICKGFVLGINKNTFFLFFTKPTKGENQVAAAALHLILH